jgi:hypothetical protein
LTGEHDHIWRCGCHDSHYLSVKWHDSDLTGGWGAVSATGYLHVEGNFWTSFRRRLLEAWTIIRVGKMHYYGVEVLLDEAKAREIVAALTEFADAAEAASETSEVSETGLP